MAVTVSEVCDVGRRAGLDAVGVARAQASPSARAVIEHRTRTGHRAGMSFTFGNPARSADPTRTMPDARSWVVGARGYRLDSGAEGTPIDLTPRPGGAAYQARVAGFSAVDHYEQLRDGLAAIAEHLVATGHNAEVLADDNRSIDREVAYRAGLGWIGRNTNLLAPGIGSAMVLGAVLTTAELPAARNPVPDGCGTCRRCIDACPTGALDGEGRLDARRCLTWLLQATGIFPVEHRVALGARIYGCDECQAVCPPTVRGLRAGSRPVHGPAGARLDVLALLRADDAEILDRYGRWYIPRRQARYVRRNALVVLGNIGDGRDPAVEEVVTGYLRHPDPLLRAHAVWCARRLGRADLTRDVALDGEGLVRAELERQVEVRGRAQ